MQLAGSGSATAGLNRCCDNFVGLDMIPRRFNCQLCGGARAYYVIMLSGRLFTRTSLSHIDTSSPTVGTSIGGGNCLSSHQHWQMHKIQRPESFSNKTVAVFYPLQFPLLPAQTTSHQLLIQPISRAALFTRKPWSHPLTLLSSLVVVLPCDAHTAGPMHRFGSPPSWCGCL